MTTTEHKRSKTSQKGCFKRVKPILAHKYLVIYEKNRSIYEIVLWRISDGPMLAEPFLILHSSLLMSHKFVYLLLFSTHLIFTF